MEVEIVRLEGEPSKDRCDTEQLPIGQMNLLHYHAARVGSRIAWRCRELAQVFGVIGLRCWLQLLA